MKASDAIAKFLKLQEIDHVFELSGGMITHLLDSLLAERMTIVTMHHEQAAAFAAEGFARIRGRAGVALATSGPGATNLITGIGSCFFDSVPCLFVTGQVNTHEQKRDRPIRQLGFQETDIVSMVRPITKAAFKIETADEIAHVFETALRLTTEGRPGPVLVDIPMNLQRAEISWQPTKLKASSPAHKLNDKLLDEILTALHRAKRPLILAGGGLRAAGAVEDFRKFLDFIQVPVVLSLMGMDALEFAHPLRAGFIGSYGNRWANLALGNADFVLVLGSRLDIRQTGADTESFSRNKVIFHVDCEEGEINNRVKNCVKVVADLAVFLKHANEKRTTFHFQAPAQWLTEIRGLQKQWRDTAEIKEVKGINPNVMMHRLSENAGEIAAYVTDVGNHQMWAAQSLELTSKQRFLTSGGMGAMGFALPTAIGASLAFGKKPVMVIAGDGGFQLNIQELQTIVRNQLPLKLLVMNNKALGMIRQFQDSYFEGRYQSTLWGYDPPDFCAVGIAYGIDSKTITAEAEMGDAFKWFLADNKPCLLQVMIDTFTNVYPKIAFGKPITEMEPFSKPVEIEGT